MYTMRGRNLSFKSEDALTKHNLGFRNPMQYSGVVGVIFHVFTLYTRLFRG